MVKIPKIELPATTTRLSPELGTKKLPQGTKREKTVSFAEPPSASEDEDYDYDVKDRDYFSPVEDVVYWSSDEDDEDEDDADDKSIDDSDDDDVENEIDAEEPESDDPEKGNDLDPERISVREKDAPDKDFPGPEIPPEPPPHVRPVPLPRKRQKTNRNLTAQKSPDEIPATPEEIPQTPSRDESTNETRDEPEDEFARPSSPEPEEEPGTDTELTTAHGVDPLVRESNAGLENRSDNWVIMITLDKRPFDNGALELEKAHKLPPLDNLTLGRARVLPSPFKGRHIIALPVKERIHMETDAIFSYINNNHIHWPNRIFISRKGQSFVKSRR